MRLYAANKAQTKLRQPLSATDTTAHVENAAPFPDNTPFLITIKDEIIRVNTINKAANTFSNLVRGQEGTTAAAHPAGEIVENRNTAGTLDAIYSEINAHVTAVTPHSGRVPQLGTADTVVNQFRALNQRIDTRSNTLSYDTSGRLSTITEVSGNTTVKTITLSYDASDRPTTVTESVAGRTITTTLTYNADGQLTSITRSVN